MTHAENMSSLSSLLAAIFIWISAQCITDVIKKFDGAARLVLIKSEFLTIQKQIDNVKIKYLGSNMYLLTEWERRTGKYLARGHGVRTEGQIFSRPARPNSVNKHFIIWPPRFSFFFLLLLFCFSGNKIRHRNVHLCRSFWPKSWDLNSDKVSSHLAKSRMRS